MNYPHSPAPWKVSFEDENPDVAIITTEGGKCLATVYPEASPEVWPRPSNELPVKANAQLIAAAPDLLELVRQAFDRFTDNDMQPPNHALRVWLDKATATFFQIKP